MAVKLDIGACTVVIYCTDCPWWRGVRLDKGEAHAAAVAHEELFHPGNRQAYFAAEKFRARNVHTRAEHVEHGFAQRAGSGEGH